MAIPKQLQAMARVARTNGNPSLALELARVARWAVTFKGWQTRPNIGPHAPSVAGLHANVTHRALDYASRSNAECYRAMINAYNGY